mmetsp:Transcript_60343/g.168590  ORF Transcript_60343/g.168590 Transcript_60343/m.168590 type:complete len:221 (-) Transcript_60343:106-768(-)
MSTLKTPLPRAESELGRNREAHGQNSYYYAHGEGWSVPENAIVRSGPGIITGGKPMPLGPDGLPLNGVEPDATRRDDVQDEVVAQLRERVSALETELASHRAGTQQLSKYLVSDEGPKCKVYVEVSGLLERSTEDESGGHAHSEAAVVVAFSEKTCALQVFAPRPDNAGVDRRAVTFQCPSDVVPAKCTYKMDRTKGKITLTFKKADEARKWPAVTTRGA